ncbi:MAG: hypothetical protein HYY84_17605 [Deltaproteobacteria bacterium]|nr:hypothetical protein [Deltaproteobacteria bacterium]
MRKMIPVSLLAMIACTKEPAPSAQATRDFSESRPRVREAAIDPKNVEIARRAVESARNLVPYRRDGWSPAQGAPVLYRVSSGGWHLGTIDRAEDVRYRIEAKRHRLDRWLGPFDVGPPPELADPAPRPDDVVLVRGRGDAEWSVGHVTAVNGDRVRVLLASAETHDIARADLVRLVPRQNAWLPPYTPKTMTMLSRSMTMAEFLSEMGVTRFDFHPHADKTIKWYAGSRRIADARYRIILSWGPYRKYTMGWAVDAFARNDFPVVPKQDPAEQAVYTNVLEDAAWEHAARIAERISADFFYRAGTLFVAVSNFRLLVPKSELETRDMSTHSRAILAESAAPKDRPAPPRITDKRPR